VCSSYITCQTCNVGFTPVSSYQCSPICSISNCLLCSDTSTCAVCSDGFQLSAGGNSCTVKCLSRNCAQCSTLDSCTNCMTGFTVAVDDFGKGVCVTSGCSRGLYPNPTNSSQCLACSLAGCDICSSSSVCSSCKPTYYLTNTTCTACSATYSNCLTCNELSCLQCQSGFVKNSQNTCIALGNCSTGCLSCSNSACIECSQSYYLNTSGLCTPKCTNGSFTNAGCSCPPGLYISNSVCISCKDTNCLSCDQVKCSQCIAGYYPLLNTCVSCLPNCDVCTSGGICDKCKSGFTLSDSSCKFNYLSPSSTQQCPFGCAECTFFNRIPFCEVLSDGFSLGFNSSIVQCASACKTCASDNASLCLSCYSGLLASGTCSSCSDPNCQSCNMDAFSCLNCNPSFTLRSGVCLSCSNNCLKCSTQGAGFCDEGGCIAGYTSLSNSHLCVKCLNGCTSCSSLDFTVCLACTDGAYLSNGACLACPKSCSSCISQTFCTKCRVGFSLRLGACYL
jgi:hypothetical protein